MVPADRFERVKVGTFGGSKPEKSSYLVRVAKFTGWRFQGSNLWQSRGVKRNERIKMFWLRSLAGTDCDLSAVRVADGFQAVVDLPRRQESQSRSDADAQPGNISHID